MRIKEFLTELKALERAGWRAIRRRDGRLRLRSRRKRKVCHCPITAIATRKGWRLKGGLTLDKTYLAADHIGLSFATANRIMTASDNGPDDLSDELVNFRGKLMLALP